MLGTRFIKPLQAEDLESYPKCAEWCDSNDAHIEEHEDYYEVVKNVPYEYTLEELTERVRAVRDSKLSDTDKYFLPDYPEVTPEVLEKIKVYRQAHRDIPEQSGFAKNVQWPVEPQFLSAKKKNEGSIGLAKVGL